MPVTKLGSVIGAITGSLRASNLTDEEKRKLRELYDLHEDSNLALRNAGRGYIGGTVGAVAGLPFGPGGILLGEAAGSYLGTNKYTRKNLE